MALSRLGTIWYVLVPMSKATIFTVTLVTFTNGWNAYFWPKIIAKNEVRRVLTVGLAQLKNTFAGQAVSNYHEIMAGRCAGHHPPWSSCSSFPEIYDDGLLQGRNEVNSSTQPEKGSPRRLPFCRSGTKQ